MPRLIQGHSAFLPLQPSPLQRLYHPAAEAAAVQWFVKRDDRYALVPNDPYQGNKVRKLKGFLLALPTDKLPIITFGGAYSNHLGALASIGQRLGLSTIGLVRGEEQPTNALLDFCRAAGMQLHYLSRSRYREKETATELARLQLEFGPAHLLPEGGSGTWVSIGAADILNEVIEQLGKLPDFFQLAAGTAGTAAGLLAQWSNPCPRERSGSQKMKKQRPRHPHGGGSPLSFDKAAAPTATSLATLEVFAALKGDWMQQALWQQGQALPLNPNAPAWEVVSDYHFGGYARQTKELTDFCRHFTDQTALPLEPIYTAKLFYGVVDRLRKGYYPAGAILVTYHSGGIYQL